MGVNIPQTGADPRAPLHRGPHPLAAHLAAAWTATGGDPAQMMAVHEGVRRYHAHPHQRPFPEMPVLRQIGTTRLLDYAPKAPAKARPLIVIPSLVNPGWVLDLDDGNSLLRWLAGQNLRPMLVDWGAPGADERAFDLDAYVRARLVPLIEGWGQAVDILGYCLGGTLAVGMAALRPALVHRLALMAAPWEMHGWPDDHRAGIRSLWQQAAPAAELGQALPMEVMQLMFASLDPGLMARKFSRFAEMDMESAEARAFVALEDWANTGPAMALPAARQFFDSWMSQGGPGAGWTIGNTAVVPEDLLPPVLAVLSETDRIVPLATTEPLALMLPHAQVLRVNAGHVGMVTGSKAKALLWEPLAGFFQ
jgi:polyhydroxyalkanoate synthase subunit PhaC